MDEYPEVHQKNKHSSPRPLSTLNFNTYKILTCHSILTFILMLGNLSLACSTNFSCQNFLPSPGYLGCFRGHDRVFIASCTLSSFVLPIFFTTTYINFNTRFSEVKKKTFVLLSLVVCISLSMLSLFDEVISVNYFPIEHIYRLSSSSFIVCSVILISLIFNELLILQVSLKESEKNWFFGLKILVFTIASLFIFDFFQWKFAFGDPRSIFNENAQAATEWSIFALSVFLPPYISKFYRESTLNFSLKIGKSPEVELTDISN